MNNQNSIVIFIDDEQKPFGAYTAPVSFEFDTRKLTDGDHVLRIVSKDPNGKEGVRKIPFVVRNGPAVAIEGITENEVVDGVIPLMINAYGKGDQKKFIIQGSETPHSIPAWLWFIIILFAGWALYYTITALRMV